ncbi:hypothetical protein AOLI_G00140870 [Acnodon oligacanthus]
MPAGHSAVEPVRLLRLGTSRGAARDSEPPVPASFWTPSGSKRQGKSPPPVGLSVGHFRERRYSTSPDSRTRSCALAHFPEAPSRSWKPLKASQAEGETPPLPSFTSPKRSFPCSERQPRAVDSRHSSAQSSSFLVLDVISLQ